MKLSVGAAVFSISVTRGGAGVRESSADSRKWDFVILAMSSTTHPRLWRSASHCSERFLYSTRRRHFKEGM